MEDMTIKSPEGSVDTVSFWLGGSSMDIWNGEIVCAYEIASDQRHSILYADKPNWVCVRQLLMYFFQHDRQTFKKICKSVDKSSKASEIIKGIIDNEVKKKKYEIEVLEQIIVE